MKFLFVLLVSFTCNPLFACTNFSGTYQFMYDDKPYVIKQADCNSISFGSPDKMFTVITDGTFQHAFDQNVINSAGKIIGKLSFWNSATFGASELYINIKGRAVVNDQVNEDLTKTTNTLDKNGNLISIENFQNGNTDRMVGIRIK